MLNDMNLNDIAKVDITPEQYQKAFDLLQQKIFHPMENMLNHDNSLPNEQRIWVEGIDNKLMQRLGLNQYQYQLCSVTYWSMVMDDEQGKAIMRPLSKVHTDRDKGLLRHRIPLILEFLH